MVSSQFIMMHAWDTVCFMFNVYTNSKVRKCIVIKVRYKSCA